MHIVSSAIEVHRTAPLTRLAGAGPKGPPSAPPTIPPIIINPFNREAPKQRIIDPTRTPPAPPIRPPGLPGMRMVRSFL